MRPTVRQLRRGRIVLTGSENRRTVLLAIATNLAVGIAKLFAGLTTGSSAMLAESFHSMADTGNEVLLLVAQWRNEDPPDERHPLGHGRETYFWALLASLGVFVTGAGLSLREGIDQLRDPTEATHFRVAYVVLVISLAFDSVSLIQAYRQLKREADILDRDFFEHVHLTSDPILRAVFAEDSAAIAGNIIALVGIGLHQVTGSTVPDGISAILIAILLGYVAIDLTMKNRDFIIGREVPAPLRQTVREVIASRPGIVAVSELIVTFLGPRRVWVVARVDIDDRLSGAQVKEVIGATEGELKRESPYIVRVDLTPSGIR
jgi:cation diffusion facilitator family transporter